MKPLLYNKLKLLTEYCLIASVAGIVYQMLDDHMVNYKALLMGSFLGFGYGIIELFLLYRFRKRFSQLPFFVTILTKVIIYLFIINIFSGTMGLAVGLLEGRTMGDFYQSMLSIDQLILSTYTLMIYVLLSFYTQINLLLGQGVLLKFLLGKYRKPTAENRIFMFLDIKSSTKLAEKLGLEKYYSLLNDFFHEISEPVRATKAEVYQYVGDEVVFTWKTEEGLDNLNCIQIFYQIQQKVNENTKYYEAKYGAVPDFKAGLHYGEVISAQIGDIKREIIYNGDVVNTSARIQELCNKFNRKLLVSGKLLKVLNLKNQFTAEWLDTVKLRGKENPIALFSMMQM